MVNVLTSKKKKKKQFLNKLFNELGITFGINAQNYCIHKDTKRISKAEKQCNPKAKSNKKSSEQ